jgi:hypothetical protein
MKPHLFHEFFRISLVRTRSFQMWNKRSLNPITFAVALVALYAGAALAQGPPGDTVIVKIDRPLQVESHSLAPGEYTIREITSASNPRVLEFTSNNGTKLEATVTAIPVMQNTPPNQTKLIVDDELGIARLKRIWVQGKTYGYEFTQQDNGASAASNTVNLQATYQAAPQPVQNARVEPAPAPAPAPPPVPVPEVAPVPQPEQPSAERAQPAPAPQEQAQSQPPAAPQPEPAPTPLPATGLGWVGMIGGGIGLAAAGLFLYRRSS